MASTRRKPYRKVGWITVAAIALLVVGVACVTAPRGTCYFEIICVEWNGQIDRSKEKLDQIVMRTMWAMGQPITPLAEIIFVPQLPAWATPHTKWGSQAAGWFDPNSEQIFVTYIADLARSVIGHELFHRELWLANGDSDVNHVDERWSRFCGVTRDNPCG